MSIDYSQWQTLIDNGKYFDGLFRANFNKVASYLFIYCKDMELSKNIAQDAFMALWENLDNVPSSNHMAYVFSSARNKLVNHYRRLKLNDRYAGYYTSRMHDIFLESIETDTLHAIYGKEIEKVLQDSLVSMNDKVRETFVLSRFGMKKNREIAQMLGVSEKLVEYRIMSALRILRKRLARFMTVLLFLMINH